MKKRTIFATALVLLIAGGVFAQEYTIYLGGTLKGFISIQKERSGKITITPYMSISLSGYSGGSVWIGKTICPILPEDGVTILFYSDSNTRTKSIVIDGNTTTVTRVDGKWDKTVIDGNTTTVSSSNGDWKKTVIDGNTITETGSDGYWQRQVINGNTITLTSSAGLWRRMVVTGNTVTLTTSWGDWAKAVINENTTTVTRGEGMYFSYEEVIHGNTTTRTAGSGYITTVVDGNTITRMHSDGRMKEVIDKQGNDIFMTLTGITYGFENIGVSQTAHGKSIIDAVTLGRSKKIRLYEGLFLSPTQ